MGGEEREVGGWGAFEVIKFHESAAVRYKAGVS